MGKFVCRAAIAAFVGVVLASGGVASAHAAVSAPSRPTAAGTTVAAPGAGNTGVKWGTPLTKIYGDVRITTPGTVIDGKEIFGLVRVEAANVTIKNSIVRGRDITSDSALIYAGATSVKNLLVQNVELAPLKSSPDINGINGSNFTLRNVNIHGVLDSVHIFGDNVTVESSWLHNNLHYVNDPNWNGGPSHDDNVQIQTGTNIRIANNTINGAVNSVMQITQDQGRTSNVTFTTNNVAGGACSLNVAQKALGAITGLVIRDNVIGASTYNCPIIVDSATLDIASITGNMRPDGAVAKVVRR